MEKVKYTSTGLVFGNLWGGGKGAYEARKLSANTKEALLKEAEKGVEDNSLDAGMGYESLIGAILNVTKITTVYRKGKEFTNKETDVELVGDLSEKDQDFLIECLFY